MQGVNNAPLSRPSLLCNAALAHGDVMSTWNKCPHTVTESVDDDGRIRFVHIHKNTEGREIKNTLTMPGTPIWSGWHEYELEKWLKNVHS
jgi:hypothetical protein